MVEKQLFEATIRPKRQITLPGEVCNALGVKIGDVLELTVEGSALVARPRKNAALDALKEIREAFKRSGIDQEQLQEIGDGVRSEVIRGRYVVK
ncbi:MAG: AbrB/MazE/SpoVT family DNA-binding domain-containing protein [Chloroflexi bacterium]|nr:AbrB/MazE/SpoVT family DNA-binding domain-containing protein [Chloroflexota bacterium]